MPSKRDPVREKLQRQFLSPIVGTRSIPVDGIGMVTVEARAVDNNILNLTVKSHIGFRYFLIKLQEHLS